MEKSVAKAPCYLETKKGHKDSITSIDVLKENQNILSTSSDDKTIRVWDLRTGHSVKMFTDPTFKDKEMATAKFSKDGSRIYQACGNGIYEFDLKTDKIINSENLKSLISNDDEINCINIDDSNKFIASCDDKSEVKIINRETMTVANTLTGGHENNVDYLHLRVS
jgi:WD40 repeat protein